MIMVESSFLFNGDMKITYVPSLKPNNVVLYAHYTVCVCVCTCVFVRACVFACMRVSACADMYS